MSKNTKPAEWDKAIASLAVKITNALQIGMAIVDVDGTLLATNSVGAYGLEKFSSLVVDRGRVRFSNGPANLAFDQMLQAYRGRAAVNPLVFGTGTGPMLIVPVKKPLNRKALAILFCDPDSREPPIGPNSLSLAFNLTEAEARLFSALLAGQSVGQYANENGVTTNTLKTQLRHIFSKIGCARQVDAVRLALLNPILRLRDFWRAEPTVPS